MTKRDIAAAIMGAGVALTVALALVPAGRSLINPAYAQAQQSPTPEQLRFLVLAIANAIASIAVDGERAAMAVNEATDRIRSLEERQRDFEKRLAEMERKR